jgi:hypothetical protein
VTFTVKSAVTVWFEFSVRTQDPVPEHAPPHPLKVVFTGISVSVTVVPSAKLALHGVFWKVQSMPTGVLVTVAEPLPVSWTVNVEFCGGWALIFAIKASSQRAVTPLIVQFPVPANTVWNAPGVVGKFAEFVSPVT